MMSGGIPSWTLAAVLLTAAIICLAITFIALRRRRHGDEPRCVRCNYDLRGMPAESLRCPECGADLTIAGAVRTGDVLPRYRLAAVFGALAVVLLSFSISRGWAWAQGVNWLPYEPLSWVLSAATPPTQSSAALGELYDRVARGQLADSQIASIAAAALAQQAGTGPWDDKWARSIEAFRRAGRLPDANWAKYVDSIFTFQMNLRPHVDLRGRPVVNFEHYFNDRRGAVEGKGTWKLRSLTINGTAINAPPVGGEFDFSERNTSSGSSGGDIQSKMEAAGPKHVTAVIDMTITASLPNVPARPADEQHVPITLQGDFVVGPTVVLTAAQRSAARGAMQRGITASIVKVGSENNLLISAQALPYRIVSKLTLRGPDGRPVQHPATGQDEAYDIEMNYTASPDKKSGWQFSLPTACPAAFDVVLSPDAEHIADGVDSSPPWPETLIIIGVRAPAATTQKK